MRRTEMGALQVLAAKRRYPRPPTELAVFLRHPLSKSGTTLRGFSKQIGLSHRVVTKLIQGYLPADKTLAQLRTIFGDQLPACKSAGEVRHDQLQDLRQRGQDDAPLLRFMQAAQQPESRARSAEAQRGRKIPANVIVEAFGPATPVPEGRL